MTGPGSKKVDRTGRSTGSRKTNRFTRLDTPFAARPIRMLESSAYKVLSLSGRRFLDRLEIEFAAHGGTSNGKLPVTYDQFKDYGIHRHAIAPARREVVALGFVVVTEAGRAGNAEWRRPNLFRLTYRHTRDGPATQIRRKMTTNDSPGLAYFPDPFAAGL